jgi:hypothetical protein
MVDGGEPTDEPAASSNGDVPNEQRSGVSGRTIIVVTLVVAVAAVAITAIITHSNSSKTLAVSTTTSSTTHLSTTTVSPTTTVPSTTTTTAPLPVFIAGSWTGRQPTTIDLAPACCSVIDNITWSSWTSAQAVGTGTWEYDTCASGCVDGPFDPYSASLTLSGPLGETFTVLEESTTGPQGGVTNWSYPQDWPSGAS